MAHWPPVIHTGLASGGRTRLTLQGWTTRPRGFHPAGQDTRPGSPAMACAECHVLRPASRKEARVTQGQHTRDSQLQEGREQASRWLRDPRPAHARPRPQTRRAGRGHSRRPSAPRLQERASSPPLKVAGLWSSPPKALKPARAPTSSHSLQGKPQPKPDSIKQRLHTCAVRGGENRTARVGRGCDPGSSEVSLDGPWDFGVQSTGSGGSRAGKRITPWFSLTGISSQLTPRRSEGCARRCALGSRSRTRGQ